MTFGFELQIRGGRAKVSYIHGASRSVRMPFEGPNIENQLHHHHHDHHHHRRHQHDSHISDAVPDGKPKSKALILYVRRAAINIYKTSHLSVDEFLRGIFYCIVAAMNA